MAITLSAPQQKLLASARQTKPIEFKDGSTFDPGTLVSGHEYRTAITLERKGLGTVRYQGPSLGWFHAKPETVIVEHNNHEARDGCDRCDCGCKYWENDTCVDCGAAFHIRFRDND